MTSGQRIFVSAITLLLAIALVTIFLRVGHRNIFADDFLVFHIQKVDTSSILESDQWIDLYARSGYFGFLLGVVAPIVMIGIAGFLWLGKKVAKLSS